MTGRGASCARRRSKGFHLECGGFLEVVVVECLRGMRRTSYGVRRSQLASPFTAGGDEPSIRSVQIYICHRRDLPAPRRRRRRRAGTITGSATRATRTRACGRRTGRPSRRRPRGSRARTRSSGGGAATSLRCSRSVIDRSTTRAISFLVLFPPCVPAKGQSASHFQRPRGRIEKGHPLVSTSKFVSTTKRAEGLFLNLFSKPVDSCRTKRGSPPF